MSLTSNSRKEGVNDFTISLNPTVAGDTVEVDSDPKPGSASRRSVFGSIINHWKTIVTHPSNTHATSAYSIPCLQPKRVMSQPPITGPIIIGTRRTMDWTPIPIVCWLDLSEV